MPAPRSKAARRPFSAVVTARARSCAKRSEPGFPGGDYARIFYVADVEASGPPIDGELHVDLDEVDFLAVFPLKWQGARAQPRTTDAPRALLESYEAERIAFARRLVGTTDQAFTLVTAEGAFADLIRLRIAPSVIAGGFLFGAVREFAFRAVSQLPRAGR